MSQDGWIDVNDELPENGQTVIATLLWGTALVESAEAKFHGSTWYRANMTEFPSGVMVTHWMRMPLPFGALSTTKVIGP